MTTKKTAPKKTAVKKTAPYAIVTADGYGLYCGYVESHDTDKRVAVLREARSIRYWYGRHGGTSSLAAHGICGPRAAESRVGSPCARLVITGALNTYECSAEARATFESWVPK